MDSGFRWMVAMNLCCQQELGINVCLSVAARMLVRVSDAFKALLHPAVFATGQKCLEITLIMSDNRWEGKRGERQTTHHFISEKCQICSLLFTFVKNWDSHFNRLPFTPACVMTVCFYTELRKCHRQHGNRYLCSKTFPVIEKHPPLWFTPVHQSIISVCEPAHSRMWRSAVCQHSHPHGSYIKTCHMVCEMCCCCSTALFPERYLVSFLGLQRRITNWIWFDINEMLRLLCSEKERCLRLILFDISPLFIPSLGFFS